MSWMLSEYKTTMWWNSWYENSWNIANINQITSKVELGELQWDIEIANEIFIEWS